MTGRDKIIEDAAADRPTAREASADDAPVKASDPAQRHDRSRQRRTGELGRERR